MAKNALKRKNAYQAKMHEYAAAGKINKADGAFDKSGSSSIETMHLAGASQRNTPNAQFSDRVKKGIKRNHGQKVAVEHGNWNLYR